MSVSFGLAVQNFTPDSGEPSTEAMVRYATRAEELGFRSLWVWDHLFLGAKRPFPFHESLTTLAVLSAHTEEILLGTGVLVLPIREPAVLAKVTGTLQIASGGRLVLGMAAGWYEREFDAAGVPFKGRGRTFERNLEILYRLWEEDGVSGAYDDVRLRNVRMLPQPRPRPEVLIGGYVDRVLKRVATRGDGWLTYFYQADAFSRSWKKIRGFAEEAGRNPEELSNVAQLPLCIADSYEEADTSVRRYVADYFDMAEWSESSPESAIRGTPEQCAEQLAAHIDAGVQHLVFAPFEYRLDQIERLAAEVLPLLRAEPAGSAR